MRLGFIPSIGKKAYWLDPEVQKDQPIPVFKPLTQIIGENLLPIGLSALALLCGLAVWLYLRKRKNADQNQLPEPPIDPYREALENIEELQKKHPRLQPKPFVFRLSEILRVYVEKLFKVPAMELTSEEFMREIVSHSFFRNRYEDLLREFMDRGDRVKYSTESMNQEGMNLLLNTALHFVKDTHLKLEEEIEQTESNPARDRE
jgi:hypothetical protein